MPRVYDYRGQESVSDLELQITMWVLEIKPGSLRKAALPAQPSLQAPYFFLFGGFFGFDDNYFDPRRDRIYKHF